MKNQQRLIVGLVLALVLIIFAVLNGQGVAVNFFGAQFTWPLIVVITVSVIIGALLTLLVSTASMAKMRKELKAAQTAQAAAAEDQAKAVQEATAELEQQLADVKKELAAATAAPQDTPKA